MKLETVKIQRGDGYVIINKSDRKPEDKLHDFDYDNLQKQGSHYAPLAPAVEVKQEKKKQVKKPKSKEV